MRRSETRALEWLKQTGHTHIEYNATHKVDFKTDQGYYEVKRPVNGTLAFQHNQIKTMLDLSAKLLIVPDRGKIVVAQPSEINGSLIHGFRVISVPMGFIVCISPELDYEFRHLVGFVKGVRRNALKECVEEALSAWVEKNRSRFEG